MHTHDTPFSRTMQREAIHEGTLGCESSSAFFSIGAIPYRDIFMTNIFAAATVAAGDPVATLCRVLVTFHVVKRPNETGWNLQPDEDASRM